MSITVESVNISERKGVAKTPVPQAEVDRSGLLSDAHAGDWDRQISLLGRPSILDFEKKLGRTIKPGEFGENLTVSGLDLRDVAILDRFRTGTVEIEITRRGKICHGDDCAIFREVGECIMPKDGLFARVLSTGTIQTGQEMTYIPYTFLVKVITVSDRASKGVYGDLSGPRALDMVKEQFTKEPWHLTTQYQVIPDEPDLIRGAVQAAVQDGVDVVITTGGTGIGPRDVTVDVVEGMADKLVPGIMDHIRLKYGSSKPNALLSRSTCAVIGNSLVYTLPGSVKAVEEYLKEIFKTLSHMILMLHGLGH